MTGSPSSQSPSLSPSLSHSDSEDDMMATAAVLSRSRRSTAGKRMSSLVGKAMEDDETFWSHSTWIENTKGPGGSGANDNGDDVSSDGSYDIKDEEEANFVDVFDSDFNDSEGEDDSASVEEETQVEQKKKKNKYVEPQTKSTHKQNAHVVAAGRELLKRRKGNRKGSSRRKLAEGIDENAGLVLNIQPDIIDDYGKRVPIKPIIYSLKMKENESADDLQQNTDQFQSIATEVQSREAEIPPQKTKILSNTVKTISDQGQVVKNSPRRSASNGSTTVTSVTKKSLVMNSKRTLKSKQKQKNLKSKNKLRKKYTQEELLLEAATTTEAENERWLLGRKRSQSMAIYESLLSRTSKNSTNSEKKQILQRYQSRRAYFNTITFMDMDRVPSILKKRQEIKYLPNKNRPKCVITGKKGRYKDPKTGKYYHDVAAFKELRRRLQTEEPLDQPLPQQSSTKTITIFMPEKKTITTNTTDISHVSASARNHSPPKSLSKNINIAKLPKLSVEKPDQNTTKPLKRQKLANVGDNRYADPDVMLVTKETHTSQSINSKVQQINISTTNENEINLSSSTTSKTVSHALPTKKKSAPKAENQVKENVVNIKAMSKNKIQFHSPSETRLKTEASVENKKKSYLSIAETTKTTKEPKNDRKRSIEKLSDEKVLVQSTSNKESSSPDTGKKIYSESSDNKETFLEYTSQKYTFKDQSKQQNILLDGATVIKSKVTSNLEKSSGVVKSSVKATTQRSTNNELPVKKDKEMNSLKEKPLHETTTLCQSDAKFSSKNENKTTLSIIEENSLPINEKLKKKGNELKTKNIELNPTEESKNQPSKITDETSESKKILSQNNETGTNRKKDNTDKENIVIGKKQNDLKEICIQKPQKMDSLSSSLPKRKVEGSLSQNETVLKENMQNIPTFNSSMQSRSHTHTNDTSLVSPNMLQGQQLHMSPLLVALKNSSQQHNNVLAESSEMSIGQLFAQGQKQSLHAHSLYLKQRQQALIKQREELMLAQQKILQQNQQHQHWQNYILFQQQQQQQQHQNQAALLKQQQMHKDILFQQQFQAQNNLHRQYLLEKHMNQSTFLQRNQQFDQQLMQQNVIQLKLHQQQQRAALEQHMKQQQHFLTLRQHQQQRIQQIEQSIAMHTMKEKSFTNGKPGQFADAEDSNDKFSGAKEEK